MTKQSIIRRNYVSYAKWIASQARNDVSYVGMSSASEQSSIWPRCARHDETAVRHCEEERRSQAERSSLASQESIIASYSHFLRQVDGHASLAMTCTSRYGRGTPHPYARTSEARGHASLSYTSAFLIPHLERSEAFATILHLNRCVNDINIKY